MKRTAYAQQGLDFVTLFTAKFHMQNVSGYAPVLREPHAESTAGGKQAIQHMILEPKIEGDPVMTIGYVNVVTKQAKIRTYECMALMHRMRFPSRAFAVDAGAYQKFYDKVVEFMRRQSMGGRRRDAPAVDDALLAPACAPQRRLRDRGHPHLGVAHRDHRGHLDGGLPEDHRADLIG